MNDIVEELKKIVNFKETTGDGDLVLIVAKDPHFLAYALVTEIVKDAGRKKDWWNVHMQLLLIPPQEVVWTLRELQFTGKEIFTMDGSERFMKAVSFVKHEDEQKSQTTVNKVQVKPGTKSNPFSIVK